MKTFFLFLFSSNLLFSQNIDWLHYQPIKCEGIIPDDFIKLSSQKFEEGKKQIDVNTKTEARKTQEQFYLNANYKMDEVLRGGRVVFGDPITSYLNQIKNLLLKDNLKLANEIRIYTLRSTDVNAFTTNDGIVLVTTGLVAQVDNEAQLAFILSHEFNHYIKKHAINEYVENRAMEKGTGIYKNISSNEIEAKAFSYSKELESEADELGLQLYKKSNYSFDAAEKVFDVLLYSYLPFDEVEFKKDYFNKESYHIPDDYFLETVNAISAIDDYDDEKNTHPNIKKRRNNILDSLKNVSDDGRKPFLISETEFNNVRKMCRYEMCLINLNNCEFEEAFYNSFLLLKDDPKNIFLNKIKSRALYGASMYKNSLHTTEYKKYYGDIEGNEEQVYFLFDKIPNLELNILALRTAFYTFLSDTTDGTVLRICNDLAKQLVRENDISFNEFADSFIVFKKDTLLNVENDHRTKTEKIKSGEPHNINIGSYWKYAFVDFMHDEKFKKLFAVDSAAATTKMKNYQSNSNEYSLGIDKLVIVDPLYLKVDETSREPVKYEAAENLKLDLQNKITSCTGKIGLDISYLEAIKLDKNNVQAFNDLALLNNWINEEFEHDNVAVINSCNEQMNELLDRYHTDHFAWFGVINFHEKKEHVVPIIALSVLYFPVLPFTIAWAVKPKYETVFFTIVADGRKGDFEMEYYNTVKANDAVSIQKSNLYYIFQQVKSKPKN